MREAGRGGAGCGPFTDGRTVAPEAARASTHTDATAPIAGCGRDKPPRSLTDYDLMMSKIDKRTEFVVKS